MSYDWEILGLALALVAFLFLAGITALMEAIIRRFLSAKPKAGVAPVSRDEMRDRLLALNGPDMPFEVREEEGSLVAEWKIADARWYKIFYAGGINELYRVVMRLDAQRNEVKSIDQRTSVRWDVGAGGLISITASYQRTWFQGLLWEKSWEKAYGFDIRKMNFEKLYEYHFDTGIVKKPIIAAVTGGGWRYRPVLWAFQVGRIPTPKRSYKTQLETESAGQEEKPMGDSRAESLRLGAGVLGRWIVDEATWREFLKVEWRATKRAAWRRLWSWSLTGPVLVALGSTFYGLDPINRQLPGAMLGFLIGSVGALLANAMNVFRARVLLRAHRMPQEAIIGKQGVMWLGKFHDWESPSYSRTAKLMPGQPNVLEIRMEALPTGTHGSGSRVTVIRIPVPHGSEPEAEMVAKSL